jgi:hypothetical protein
VFYGHRRREQRQEEEEEEKPLAGHLMRSWGRDDQTADQQGCTERTVYEYE